MKTPAGSRIRTAAVVSALVTTAASSLLAQGVTTTRVSVGSGGTQSPLGALGQLGSIAADGRHVVFTTGSILSTSDTNAFNDVYVHDRQTQITTIVSLNSAGTSANNWVHGRAISRDGRFVCFQSPATNMVTGAPGNGTMYVVDTLNPGPVAVSLNNAGQFANAGSTIGVVSDDGRFSAFETVATNLGAPGNIWADVFRRDIASGTIAVASTTSTAAAPNDSCNNTSISADGRYVIFDSSASNILPQSTSTKQVYRKDMVLGTVQMVSLATGGAVANGTCFHGKISADGRFVAFSSFATNLVANDTNGVSDVFVRDLVAQTTTRVSVSSTGAEGNAASGGVVGHHLSATGRYVVFHSDASNLDTGDTNGVRDVFLHDRLTHTTQRVSLSTGGQQATAACEYPTVSADGRSVCYWSTSANLVANDTNGQGDFFVSRPGTGLDCVDAASEENGGHPFINGTAVTTNPNLLASGGTETWSVAADGEARLLLRFVSDTPGVLTVGLATPVADEGAIAVPGGAYGQTALPITLQQVGSQYYAFCVYRAPDDFVRQGVGADLTAPSRIASLSFSFLPQGTATPVTFPADITVVRPPVVFCHGLWSDRDTWKGPQWEPLTKNLDPRFEAVRAEYGLTSAESFFKNAHVATDFIKLAQRRMRNRGIACARVDWVGHSMGGILPRFEYRLAQRGLTSRPWERADNYGAGDLHKIILLNSPQWGSPWANVLTGLRQKLGFASSFQNLGRPIGPAIDDLEEGSDGLLQLGTTPFRAHAIVSTGLENTVAATIGGLGGIPYVVPAPWSTMIKLGLHYAAVTAAQVYRGQAHDLVVLAASQAAGLPIANQTQLSDLLQTLHTSVTGWSMAHTTVETLLNARMTAFSTSMPPPNPMPPRLAAPPTPTAVADPIVDGVEVVLLTTGTIQSGQQIQVEVRGKNGFVPANADALSSSELVKSTATSAPFTVAMTVPITAAGDITFIGLGVDAGGATAISLPLTVAIQTPAALQSMQATAAAVEMYHPLQKVPLRVEGAFADLITRDITRAAAGTVYASSNPAVVSVTTDGLLTAHTEGEVTITVTNGATNPLTVPVAVEYGAIRQYGEPSPGAGGFWPLATTGGEQPNIGNANFKIQVDQLTGGVAGTIYLSAGPDATQVVGLNVHIDLLTANGAGVTATGTAGVPGVGTATLPLAIPNDATLIGAYVYFQGLFFDSGAALGASTSNGLVVRIQP